jgi:SRSO17 transposase
VTTTDLEAAAASTVEEATLACGKLDELMGALAGCFARVEPRREARKYVTGLISDLPRKNCWALAEHAGDATPDKMQRLLERAAWDASAAMRVVRQFAVAGLGEPAGAVLVVDESGQEKAGERTAGVQRQYLGCAGRVANGINVVYASYAAPAGHAVISARLYVPVGWAGDLQRRRAAGIPGDLQFKTKPQLAIEMLGEIIAGGCGPPWVTGDEVYGRDARLRAAIEAHRTGYVLKIPCSFRITLPTGQKMRADHAARLVPARAWQGCALGAARARRHRRPGGARRGAPEHTGGVARGESDHGGGAHRRRGRQRAVRPQLVPLLRAPRPHRGRARGSGPHPGVVAGMVGAVHLPR